jgi:hypothetical protein
VTASREVPGQPVLRRVLGVSLLVAPAAATVWAQAMPFHTPTALPLPLAESSIRSFYEHRAMHTLLDNGREVANPQGLRGDVDAVPLMVPQAVTPSTILIAGIPYLHKTFGQSGTVRTNSGFGDAVLMVRQTVLAADFIKGNRRMVVFAGATLPTGETESDSGPLPVPLRLGLGTVNVLGQAAYSYVNDRLGIHGALGYAAATAAKFGVRIGDRLSYDFAFGYRLLPATYRTLHDVTVAGYLELDGTVEQPATRSGDPLANSGGHTLSLSPGLQVIPVPNWAIEGSFQLPVVRQLRGTQLGPTRSLAVGVRTVLDLVGL